MKTIAILGPTASGKTDIALELAQKREINILSLDSLSIYKEIDIASAKPTKSEREALKHFGVYEIYPDSYFSVSLFFDIYKRAKTESEKEGKDLLIVGGTGFYLKSLIDGLSPSVNPSKETIEKTKEILEDLDEAYRFLSKKDRDFASSISTKDRYRLQKWYEIYFESGKVASEYFKEFKRDPVLKDVEIFEIDVDRESLRERISLRTSKMLESGLVDEVAYLEKRYTRAPNPMRAIGIKETLSYLDGQIEFKELHPLISTHTAQLAKRQRTFNRSQFPKIERLIKQDLKIKLLSIL
jgi:tRNA dimethylallyltransferase